MSVVCPRCGHSEHSRTPFHSAQSSSNQYTRDRLASLAVEIEAVSAYLNKISAEHAEVQTELDSIIYPILTIPPEVTSDIFVHCLGEPDPSISIAPLLLGRICRSWRSISCSTPALWGSLTITLPLSAPGRQKLYNLLCLWLSRSGSYPFELAVFSSYSKEQISHTFFPTILEHAHHLESITLHLLLPDLEQFLDIKFSDGFPILKRFEIIQTGMDTSSRPVSFSAITNSACLTNVAVDGELLGRPLPRTIPWAQLTTFFGMDFGLDQVCEVLTLASSLQVCDINFGAGNVDEALLSQHATVTHTRLHILSLRRDRHPCADFGLFALLTMPALQRLYTSICDEQVPRFLEFLSRSSCQLAILHADLQLRTSNLAPCLAALPHLVELELGFGAHGVLTGSFGEFIILVHRKNRYMPKLAKLVIWFGGSRIDYELLLDTLESRRDMHPEAPTQLDHFELHSISWSLSIPAETQLKQFAKLDAEGMIIIITQLGGESLV
ncbi:hypothetical protein C8J57DRAFT_338937 [Mycena rebaudengoi]|nr:hypothetical protein C8J57DRAFT_338937 [Mycena rebaudengoi]